MRLFVLLVYGIFFVSPALAQCVDPPGEEAVQVYNSTHKVMQYCDGEKWIGMGGGGGDALGELSCAAGQILQYNGTEWACIAGMNSKVSKAGDTMTGPLNVPAPTAGGHAANRTYVDGAVAGVLPNCATGQVPIKTGGGWGCVELPDTPAANCALDGVTVAHGDSRNFYQYQMHANCAGNLQSRECNNGILNGSSIFQYANCNAPTGCTLDGVSKDHGESHTFYSAATHANCASVAQSRECNNGTFSGDESFDKAACAPPASPCASDGGVDGTNGECYILGAANQSCTAACTATTNYKYYRELTRTEIGSGGTNQKCAEILTALGAPGSGDPTTVANAAGCMVNSGGTRNRGTTATTASATRAGYQRACACNGTQPPIAHGGNPWIAGMSCSSACSNYGGCHLTRTRGVGTGGSNSACKAALEALYGGSISVSATNNNESPNASGCYYMMFLELGFRETSLPTTCEAMGFLGGRACSCNGW